MLTSLRSNLFYLLAALLLASVATTQTQAQEASSRTPIAVVYNVSSGRHIGTFYESSNGDLWAVTEVGEPRLSIITRVDGTVDGDSILYFDQYTLQRTKMSASDWVRIASGQFVLTGDTVTGGRIGYVVVTHNHLAGEVISVNERVFTDVQIEPIGDPVSEPTPPLNEQRPRSVPRQPNERDREPILLASYQPSGR